MESYNFVKNTLDSIPTPDSDAKKIVGLVKERGKIVGYKLSSGVAVSKEEAVNMAKQGKISGVGIAHRGSTEYLKAVPNGDEGDNLSNLPTVSSKI